jgi:hypothetical protein
MSKQKVAFLTGERPSTTVNVGISILIAIAVTAVIFAILWQLRGTFIRDLFIGRYENDPVPLHLPGPDHLHVGAVHRHGGSRRKCAKRVQGACCTSVPIPEDLDMTDIPNLIEVYENL